MKKKRKVRSDSHRQERLIRLLKLIKQNSVYGQCFMPKRALGKLMRDRYAPNGLSRQSISSFLDELEDKKKVKRVGHKLILLKDKPDTAR
jgi:hypothetical protein